MSQAYSSELEPVRNAAVQAADAVLLQMGFLRVAARRWKGRTPGGRQVEVQLHPDFPDHLPELFLPRSAINGHIAHVDGKGKICIAPASGTLLDATRPEALVADALTRADSVLAANPSLQMQDIEGEYLAYWKNTEKNVTSICSARQPTGPVRYLELSEPGCMSLVAPDSHTGKDWALAVGKRVLAESAAYFVRLKQPIKPPAFQRWITLRELLQLVDEASEVGTASSVRAWLSAHGLPATILLSAPLHKGTDVISGVVVPTLKVNSASKALHGYRPGHMPPDLQAARATGAPVERIEVSRADPDYLLLRGGGVTDLRNKTVVVIGCGSVGSFTAGALAASGVGHLILIDHEVLTTDNIHRHLLGAAHLGLRKVAALATVLRSRFPHLTLTQLATRAEEALDRSLPSILSSDLIVFAIGEETLELRLNGFLVRGPRRLHAWLEPLGIGGHVLRIGSAGHPGCFECLFRRDPEHGLLNRLSLVAPGQNFQRSLAGCSGTFTPFGALDAERAGIEAARAAIACLTDGAPEALLTSWTVSKASAISAGFRLSPRGEMIAEGTTIREPRIAVPTCPVCSAVAQ